MMKDTTLASPAMMPSLSRSLGSSEQPAFTPVDRAKQRRAEVREFKVTVAVLFAVLLPIAVVSRVLPKSWRPLGKLSGAAQSPICEARTAANTIAPFMLCR